VDLARAIARAADANALDLITTVDEVNYYARSTHNLASAGDVLVATNGEALVGPPTRMIAVGREGIAQLYARLGDLGDLIQVHRYRSRVGGLESAVMTHPLATKVEALAELCAAHGIDAAEVMALGDAEADAAMIRWAGVGVAMADAMPEARDAAKWIAPSNDAAGVASAVERYVLSGNREQGTGNRSHEFSEVTHSDRISDRGSNIACGFSCYLFPVTCSLNQDAGSDGQR
jgi:hypothetical protein